VIVDPARRLWLLDTGSIEFGETLPRGPKLVCVDLQRDEVVQWISVPREIADGRLEPRISIVRAWEETHEVLGALRERRARGKAVLTRKA